MKFLLEGKEWPGQGAVKAPEPVMPQMDQPAPAVDLSAVLDDRIVQWLAETEDYGLRLMEVNNPGVPMGAQLTYVIEHKKHRVIANNFQALPQALQFIQALQEALNECLGKNTKPN